MARMITRQEAAKMLDVDVQTISNWIEKGALTGHHVPSKKQGKDIIMVDKQSIEQYFDTLLELSKMEQKIILLKNTLTDLQQTLAQKACDACRATYLFGDGISSDLLQKIFSCVLEVAGDRLLVERECTILHKLVFGGWSVNDLAEEYGLSCTRIMQIVNKAINKICTMQKWPDVHRDYKRLQQENRNLFVLVDNQKAYIKQLEQQLNINKDGDGGESVITGYTKRELAEVLSRRLSHEKLTIRTLNCLKQTDIETVSQLIRKKAVDLLKIRHFGKKSLDDVNRFLGTLNLSLGMNVSDLIDAQIASFMESNNQ